MQNLLIKYSLLVLLSMLFITCSSSDHRIIEEWPDGTPKISKKFINSRDTFLFQRIEYFPNGTIEKLTHMEGKVVNGWEISYFPNGMVRDSVFIRDNKLFSNSTHYFSNGNLRSSGSYNENGNRDGTWYDYYYQGPLYEKSYFGNGIKINESLIYDPHSELAVNCIRYSNGLTNKLISFSDGEKHGQYCKFDDQGHYVSTGHYNRGSKRGTKWSDYYSDGAKFRDIEFDPDSTYVFKVIDLWNKHGEKTVEQGNGYFTYFISCDGQNTRYQVTITYKGGKEINRKEREIGICN